MAIERRVTEIAGRGRRQAPHRALAQRPGRHRRRDVRARPRRIEAREPRSGRWRQTLIDLAERHLDWPMPGYTHLQRAQPVYLEPPPARLRRGCSSATASASPRCSPRPARCRSAPARWPASTSTPTARWSPRELGFAGVAENSIDAVSNRDFVLDYLAAAATCATHLSRLGAEIVLWSSEEFGFCEVSDAWASGSSIMPQKKNPDAAELLRAKAPRIVAHLVALHGVMHGLPLTYNKDMQEDKEHAVRRRRHARALPRGSRRACSSTITFNRERLARGGRPTSSWPPPTSPICWSGAGCRSARRTASSPAWCARPSRAGKPLSELTPEELPAASPLLDEDVLRAARATAPGSSPRSPRAGPASPRSASSSARACGAERARWPALSAAS